MGIVDKEGDVNKYVKFNLVDKYDVVLIFDNVIFGEYVYVLYDGDIVIVFENY